MYLDSVEVVYLFVWIILRISIEKIFFDLVITSHCLLSFAGGSLSKLPLWNWTNQVFLCGKVPSAGVFSTSIGKKSMLPYLSRWVSKATNKTISCCSIALYHIFFISSESYFSSLQCFAKEIPRNVYFFCKSTTHIFHFHFSCFFAVSCIIFLMTMFFPLISHSNVQFFVLDLPRRESISEKGERRGINEIKRESKKNGKSREE